MNSTSMNKGANMAFVNPGANTPINREEELTALKAICNEYQSLQSITGMGKIIIACVKHMGDAAALTMHLRSLGWLNTTAHKGQYTDVWFVRVTLNT